MHMINRRIVQQGVTLVELLVAVIVGLVILGGAFYAYIGLLRHSSEVVAASKVDVELTQIAQTIANEVRRAGYSGNIPAGGFGASSDYIKELNGKSCLAYRYHEPIVGISKWYGYKHDAVTNELKSLTSDTEITDCATGPWVTLSNASELNVTGFTVDFSGNMMSLTLAGKSKNASASYSGTRTLSTRVFLRN